MGGSEKESEEDAEVSRGDGDPAPRRGAYVRVREGVESGEGAYALNARCGCGLVYAGSQRAARGKFENGRTWAGEGKSRRGVGEAWGVVDGSLAGVRGGGGVARGYWSA